jgi:hypothetical protein
MLDSRMGFSKPSLCGLLLGLKCPELLEGLGECPLLLGAYLAEVPGCSGSTRGGGAACDGQLIAIAGSAVHGARRAGNRRLGL